MTSKAKPANLVSTMQPTILITEGADPKPLAWIRQHANVIEIPVTDSNFDRALATADGLMVRTYTKVNAALLGKAPKLKVVGRGGVGLENIDVPACRARGVQVVYTPDANTFAVADFCIGYMLMLVRGWGFYKNHAYTPAEFKHLRDVTRGRQLDELTLGILGMGRVGRRVSQIAANGFGMKIIYNDILNIPPQSLPFPATPVDKTTLYREADVLSIHVNMMPANDNLVGREQLALMKPSAIVINAARGEVLDAQALADALRARKLGGAALDVFRPEPPPADFPLIGMENVLLTPHLAARTDTALENMSWVLRDIFGVLEGKPPLFPAP